jgi:hypothetical protein
MGTKRDELNVAMGPCGSVFAIGGFGALTDCDDSSCLNSAERFDFEL